MTPFMVLAGLSLTLSSLLAQTPENYYTDERLAVILSTDFIIPMVRYDLLEERVGAHPKGRVSAFSSLGAGLTFSLGNLKSRFSDANKTSLIQDNGFDFKNMIALQGGVLFSINNATNSTSTFAPVVGVNVLDFSMMWGYDLGITDETLDGHFWTIAYNVPLRKIFSKAIIPIWRQKKDDETAAPGRSSQYMF